MLPDMNSIKQPPVVTYKHVWSGWWWLKHRSYYIVVLSCLIIALSAAAPLWGPGIVNTRGGGDSPFLVQRTLDMAENIQHGGIPPRWMAHAAYDYGYPFFNHYGALPYYISAGLTLIGFPVTLAIQSTQTLGFVLAALAMALWTNQLFKNHWATVLSVAAYTYAPFHMVNVYVRGDSLSEFYAFLWFPLILWAFQQYIRRRTWTRLLIAACAYSGLVLTHNTSAVAFSPFVLFYGVSMTLKSYGFPRRIQNKVLLKKYLMPIIAPFLLGMLLTMWFWLPALAEVKFGQLGPDFTEGYFHHSQHYRGLNLVQTSPTFDYGIAVDQGDSGPFAMGFMQTVLVLVGVLNLLRIQTNRICHWLKIFLLIGLVLTTFIMTPLSSFLWDNISLLSIMQFPWRFLSIQSLFTAVIIASIPFGIFTRRINLAPIRQRQRWIRSGLTAGAVILLAGAAFFQLHPDRLLIDSDDATWETLKLYEAFTGNIGTTIRFEYLPRNVVPRPYITQAVLDDEILPQIDGKGELHAQLLERSPIKFTWHIQLDNTLHPDKVATIVFPLYWWPGWRAKVDGTSIPTYAFIGSGQLALNIPEGTHEIVLRLRPTRLQDIALITSCVTAALLSIHIYRERHRMQKGSLILHMKRVSSILLLCAIALIVPVFWYQPVPEEGTYFDFDQMPYPHAGPIDYGLAKLTHSDISSEIAAPGDELEINLQWTLRTTEPLSATLRLVSPAEHRHNVSYTLMETQVMVVPNLSVQLHLPDDLSRGLYLVQLRIYAFSEELEAKTPQGRRMGPLFIGAIRVPEGTKSTISPSASTSQPIAQFVDLNLHAFEAHQTESTVLHVDMKWTTPGTPRNWSLSLRLLDLSGKQISQFDTQPGYGYLPTSMWHPGEWIFDDLELKIPEGIAPGNYQIRIITYLQATMENGGEIDIPIRLVKPTLYDLRNSCCEQTRKGATILCQNSGIALLGIDSPEIVTTGENLSLIAEWNAVSTPTADITAEWALVNPDNEIISSVDRPLAVGSDTSSWPLHTWVLNTVNLSIDPLLTPGTYQLQVHMKDRGTVSKLCRVKVIVVQQRAREYIVASLPHEQQAIFNNEIKLLGYDIEILRNKQRLELTLWWQAEKIPQLDYKRFVHLYDPAENHVITQDDAMPRDWTYPTTWWYKGEIISETITLSLTNIPKGTYNLGVGWYIPETLVRLQAYTNENQHIEDDRLTLSLPIIVR
jgi:hypothetical protein